MENNKCINCSSSNLTEFIDLGSQPNGNAFPSSQDLENETFYPFNMLVCDDCWQVQLAEFPPVEDLFSNHPYISGLNQPVVLHMDELAKAIIKKLAIPQNSLVLDIGANDGTLLSKFRDKGMRVLGVDPCERTGKLAKEADISVWETFWNEETARSMAHQNIRPRVITATAVFYHVNDLHSFIRGLDTLMGDDSYFVTQCVYLKDIIEKFQFDHFYHEHTMIHAIKPLQRIFKEHGFRILDIELNPIHGGSFIMYIAKEQAEKLPHENVQLMIEEEEKSGLFDLETYRHFTRQVNTNKNDLVDFLNKLKQEGKKVFGLGAPVKGSTLLNFYGIGPELVEKVVEVNEHKIGRYTPGTHIPIVAEPAVQEAPDYYLVLTWNFLDFLTEKYADFLDNGGKFIISHPELTIIEGNGQRSYPS